MYSNVFVSIISFPKEKPRLPCLALDNHSLRTPGLAFAFCLALLGMAWLFIGMAWQGFSFFIFFLVLFLCLFSFVGCDRLRDQPCGWRGSNDLLRCMLLSVATDCAISHADMGARAFSKAVASDGAGRHL